MIPRLGQIALWLWVWASFASSSALAQAVASSPTQQTNVAALQAEVNQAMDRVRAIVNQPVTRIPRRPGMRVSIYRPGWFHEGAVRPNFTIDVRTSQLKSYDQQPYVSSDLNPGFVFIGPQLEFNAELKYFYTDRTLPKKKLTEAEMLEINRLFRIIGNCEKQLGLSQNPPVADAPDAGGNSDADGEETVMVRVPVPRSRYIACGIALAAVLTAYAIYRKFAR